MSKKVDKISNNPSTETSDQVIADLMEQRKLQQEALIKIMSSMDKNSGPPEKEKSQKKIRFRLRKNKQ